MIGIQTFNNIRNMHSNTQANNQNILGFGAGNLGRCRSVDSFVKRIAKDGGGPTPVEIISNIRRLMKTPEDAQKILEAYVARFKKKLNLPAHEAKDGCLPGDYTSEYGFGKLSRAARALIGISEISYRSRPPLAEEQKGFLRVAFHKITESTMKDFTNTVLGSTMK